MAKASLTIRGLDQYMERLAQAQEDIDQVVADVLDEARAPAEDMLHDHLRESSETWTGEMASQIDVSPVVRDGNFLFILLKDSDPGAIYKEYGRPRQAADPFLRPTLEYFRRKGIKQMLKRVLERMGVQ
jgi:hypothetical protein